MLRSLQPDKVKQEFLRTRYACMLVLRTKDTGDGSESYRQQPLPAVALALSPPRPAFDSESAPARRMRLCGPGDIGCEELAWAIE